MLVIHFEHDLGRQVVVQADGRHRVIRLREAGRRNLPGHAREARCHVVVLIADERVEAHLVVLPQPVGALQVPPVERGRQRIARAGELGIRRGRVGEVAVRVDAGEIELARLPARFIS